MPILDYIIHFTGYWLVFFLIYKLFISSTLRFKTARYYLITATVLAWILPFIQISQITDFQIDKNSILIQLYTHTAPSQILSSLNYTKILLWVYAVGFCIQFFRFLSNLAQVGQLIERYPRQKQQKGFYEIRVPKLLEAFSFFNYLFIPESSHYSEQEFVLIKEHEVQHIIQKHTRESIFFEILTAVLWFHPLVYSYKNELKKLHEFSADFGVLNHYSDLEFYKKILISNFLEQNNLTITHPFSDKKVLQSRLKNLTKYGQNPKLSWVWIWFFCVVIFLGIGLNSVWYKIAEKQDELSFEASSKKANFPSEFQGQKEFSVSENRKVQRLKTAMKAGKKYVFDLDHDSDLPKGTKVTLYDSEGNLVAENFGKYKSKFVFQCTKTDIYTLRISFRYAQFQKGKLQVSFD